MSMLGKVLIFLNLLAAGAFAYFTLENYGLRQKLAFEEFARAVKLRGIPVEAPEKPGSVGSDEIPFQFQVNEGTHVQTLEKSRLNTLIPAGDQAFGGEAVPDQTAEVKRLQKKVIDALPPAGAERLRALHTYLLNLARSGADRDGVNGLFDLLNRDRAVMARRDLPFLGRTSSQVAGLRALVEVADLERLAPDTPENVRAQRVGLAREAVKRFLLGEAPHGAASGGDRDEAERRLRNAIVGAMEGRGGVDEIKSGGPGFEHLAALAAEQLNDRASTDRAAAAIAGYVQSRAVTEPEKAGLAAVATLIRPPALNFVPEVEINNAATNLLTARFEEAALPVKPAGPSAGEKARKIAHLLYHIDAHRHAAKDGAVANDRKAWHQRVSTIVGMQEYVRAAEAQASEYAEAAQRLFAVIAEEESSFRAQYQDQLQRVTTLYTQWLTLEAQYRAQDAITKENIRLRNERETERDTLKKRLEEQIEVTKASLEKLRHTQAALFDIQKQLRDAQAAVLNLEGELRKLELGKDEKR